MRIKLCKIKVFFYFFRKLKQYSFSLALCKSGSLKNTVKSLIRNGVITAKREQIGYGFGGRSHQYIQQKELNKLHNAILIQGIFSDPKIVKSIFVDSEKRKELAGWARSMLQHRQSALSIGLISNVLESFLCDLESDLDLSVAKLANPFTELPQLALNGLSSTLKVLVAQSAVLSQGDSMMAHYFNGDLEAAKTCAESLSTEDPTVEHYRAMIIKAYKDAKDFDDLLDTFK